MNATTFNTVDAIREALDEAMAADPNVVVFGEDVADPEGGGVCKASAGLSTKYGTRVRSTPISEQAIIGAAIGASLAGLRPVAEIMLMNFTAVAMDQIVNHAAKLRFMSGGQTNVPITIRTMTGTGFSAGAQHSDMLEAWFAHTPGLKVVSPSSPAEAKGLLLSCIFDNDPCLFIENLPSYWVAGARPDPAVRIPLGKANVLREGSHVTVVSYSRTISDVLQAAAKAHEAGISVEIIDLRTISPLDMPTIIGSVSKTKRALIVHEAVRDFGVGAEIAAHLSERLFLELRAPVARLGAPYAPVPFSRPLELAYAPAVAQIESEIRRLATFNR